MKTEIDKPQLPADVRRMSLDGADAIGLFAAEMGNNIAVLGEQLCRLQAALAARIELLTEIDAGKDHKARRLHLPRKERAG